MHGRVPPRPSSVSRLPRRSPSQTLSSCKEKRPTNLVVPKESTTSTLREFLCKVFVDAQASTVGHRKLIISLRKIQESCCYEPAKPGKEGQKDFNEDDFNVEIARCVIRFMGVKKSEVVGDRIIRFLGQFLRHASEKDAASAPESEMDDTRSFPETATTRLVSHIFSFLLQLLSSKDKTVRYRSTQLAACIINTLDSIDDECYHLLRTGLLKRIRDKEPAIRVQAVLGLGRLAGNEDDVEEDNEDSGDDSIGLLERLLDVLQNDPSADVRRSLLVNLPLTPATLPYLLERARDSDSATRRALYSRLLPALGDFRHLSLSMREKLLRWGLRDRDDNVRRATARLFYERWIEDCAGSRHNANDKELGAETPSIPALLELLERIDVINSGVEQGIASEALKEFWAGRPDYQQAITFNDPFWDHLSSESAFMARSFNHYCHQQGNEQCEILAEEKMPEVTKLAFFLQKYINDLVDCQQRNFARYEGDDEEHTAENEFIVEQLLHIAKTLDYSDEVGRRKMFTFLRESLALAELPDEITKLSVDILRDLCGRDSSGERDFCGVVLEAVAEVHDAIASDKPLVDNEDESFHLARSAISDNMATTSGGPRNLAGETNRWGEQDDGKAIKEIMVNMKCLHIAQCMLQNVEGDLQQNVHLVTMLNNLVVPAVRSHEAPIRERGLLCLGLCCLLDITLANENLTLFLHCFAKGHDTLQVTAVHILADILATHPSILLTQDADKDLRKQFLKIFAKGINAENTPVVQSAATIALCKLMLTSVIQDVDLLKQIVICYFDPATKGNAEVRQALAYFLPAYCFSRRENMERMAVVAGEVVLALVDIAEEFDGEEDMVGMSIVGNMLVDWTDARKLIIHDEASVSWDKAGRKEVKAVNGDIHLDFAISLLEQALTHGCSKEVKKALTSILGKLYITSNSDPQRLSTTAVLVVTAIDNKVANDAPSRNALQKLHSALSKAMGEASRAKSDDPEGAAMPVDDKLLEDEGRGVETFMHAKDEDMSVLRVEGNESIEAQDSLLNELLTDEEELILSQ